MIKNRTPYLGKIRLKFEKFPHYSGKDKLNKVHLNLGFTKLVSRITPFRDFKGWIVNPECIKLIEENTGLKIKTHTIDHHGQEDEFVLYHSSIHPDGHYVGSIEEGWWYYTNKLRATKGSHPHTAWHKEKKQWVGYSHRASQSFGKGDKLFTEDWTIPVEDLLSYDSYYMKHIDKFYEEVERWAKTGATDDLTLAKWATEYIPFRRRGSKTIHSYEQAYEAAVNFAKYVS
ncbi:hypothetical protein UFOVP1604_120 [uncultured Caudovirales phage]|uniref:Uncharacterized protein n=1 Tax=uncultured Caudovirales phage TaxID=2100421 RepID=A0A6J5SX70_9CAUD|nr:hypothetical protein UFOVP1604_120 [uncultured Caudovirales phage]